MITGLTMPCSQDQFAAIVGITQQRVAQLVADGVLPREGTAGQWLLAYAERLREQAAGRGQELMIERAGLAREQRIGQQIKNAVAQGEFAPVSLLTDVLAATSSAVVTRFDALAGDLGRLCPDLDDRSRNLVLEGLAKARNEWVRGTEQLVTQVLDELSEPEAEEDLSELPSADDLEDDVS